MTKAWTFVVVLLLCVEHGRRQPSSAADARFDALAALAEAKMKEYGVPGVALGIVHDGNVIIRGLGVTNLEDPLPVTAHTVFPDRVDLQDVRGDGDDAARRAGQGRPPRAGAHVPAGLPRARRGRESRRDGVASADAPRRLGRPGVRARPRRRDAEELRRVDHRPDAGRAAGSGVELQQRGVQHRGPRDRSRHRHADQSRDSRSRVPAARSRARRHDGRRLHRPAVCVRARDARRHDRAHAAVHALGRASPRAASGSA